MNKRLVATLSFNGLDGTPIHYLQEGEIKLSILF
jgi:hypothetical protein